MCISNWIKDELIYLQTEFYKSFSKISNKWTFLSPIPVIDTTASANINPYHNMNVWILVGNGINFPIAASLIRSHMPGGK